MNLDDSCFSMEQTDAWLADLAMNNRKEGTIRTHRNNVRRCLETLHRNGRPTDAFHIGTDDVHILWRSLHVKETVRTSYLRSLSAMVEFHTGVNIFRKAAVLRNRQSCVRVFIGDPQLRIAFLEADPMQRLVICFGAYMGLRRAEMAVIRDVDIGDRMLLVHGKGHGDDGLMVFIEIPKQVTDAIAEYREWSHKRGPRNDDYLIQSRDHRGNLHRIDPSRISDCITRLSKKLGFPMTTHSLRRYYATTLYYQTGCDVQTVRRLMRHADVSTTLRCYVDAYDKQAMDATERLIRHIDGVVVGDTQRPAD